jgi:hypothetical protein
MEVPTGLFYPFYPENQFSGHTVSNDVGNEGSNGGSNQDFTHLLAAAAAQPDGAFAQESFVLEERDPHPSHNGGIPIWMNVVGICFLTLTMPGNTILQGTGQRGLQSYAGS